MGTERQRRVRLIETFIASASVGEVYGCTQFGMAERAVEEMEKMTSKKSNGKLTFE